MVISPTVGRVVWYRPTYIDRSFMTVVDEQPLAATVVYVVSDYRVNLSIADHAGDVHKRSSVTLRQEEYPDSDAPAGGYCEWMPYQIGQAKAQTGAAQ